ncbi:putative transporter svop-1, partial [Stegodyphus dumicola]|uniref:putative transporter svop-1 n=1 Tax=Stegodyphus dumicola TaxID=202533 RepID=UPI0015B3642F
LAAAVTVTGLDILTPFIAQGRLKSENTITWFLNASEKNDTSKEPCFNSMSQNEFIEILWTSSLDFPGFVIFILLVDYIDRKKLLCASFLIVSLFVFLLLIPTENVTAHVGFLFCAKTLIVSQFELLLLAAAETYPTTERGVAIGVEVATFNAGFLAGFYIIQVLSQLGTYYIYSLLGCLPFSCAVAAVLLPWETRGMELLDFCKI